MNEKELVAKVLEIMRERQPYKHKYRASNKKFDAFVKQVARLTLQMSQTSAAEVLEEIDKLEEGFEGTAVEFCEKYGNASYTGFKECLKEIRKRLKVKE